MRSCASPSLLVLDDTTSALDPATEAIVLANLRRELADTSVLMVASRPSTIALADDVVFVADGRVAAHGTHDELMESTAAYRELVEAFESDRSDRDGAIASDRMASRGVAGSMSVDRADPHGAPKGRSTIDRPIEPGLAPSQDSIGRRPATPHRFCVRDSV